MKPKEPIETGVPDEIKHPGKATGSDETEYRGEALDPDKIRESLEAIKAGMIVREPLAIYGKTKLSIPEYLEWETGQEEKHENIRGRYLRCSVPGWPTTLLRSIF